MLASMLLPMSYAAVADNPAGADQHTPSYAQYFSWINNTNEGSTAAQTKLNLDFFQWLHDRYGMQLDIYAFDAGAIDGAKSYGSTSSARFKQQFPEGFGPLSRQAAKMGTRLGIWCGPDGFGNTPEEAEKRIDMMVGLVKDYNFAMFKMDGVCGQLRRDKLGYFDRMMSEIHKLSPGFILLNHRLQLYEAAKYSTTTLLGGAETYIDVFQTNDMTATHNRAMALSRKGPEDLNRLTEDHGVCLSSCMDYWEDDLVLQAFNRCMILAPELYGNPWLLRDEEYPYLAYVYNLHRKYRDILVDGMRLPEAQYGPEAVARGNGKTCFLALRNLTWNPVRYKVKLDKEVGLETAKGSVKARLYHPYILDMGNHKYGETIEVEVLPFRAALLKLTTEAENDEVALSGIPYHIINDKVGNVAEVKLLGKQGHTYSVRLTGGADKFRSADIDGQTVKRLLSGKIVKVSFGGKPFASDFHRKLASLTECKVPADAENLYYATCFAADNNALEARSAERAGATNIPQVKAARDAFLDQKLFRDREIWDKNLFDGDTTTAFSVAMRWGDSREGGASCFTLDMKKAQEVDSIVIRTFDEYSLTPLKSFEGLYVDVSKDLKSWKTVSATVGTRMQIDLRGQGEIRYLRFNQCPLRLTEVAGYKDGRALDRTGWRASNLFRNYGPWTACVATQAWKGEFTLDEIQKNAYLCIAVNGVHGRENAWAALKVDGEYVGCPNRAPSFKSNTWEYTNNNGDRNYTYYVPLTPDMAGKKIEAYVLGLDYSTIPYDVDRPTVNKKEYEHRLKNLKPEVWVTSYPLPFESKDLKLNRK